MPDDLNLALDREVILFAGGPAAGKSDSIVRLALMGLEQEFNIVVLDRDRGVAKSIRELCGREVPENLDYFLVNSWDKVTEGINYAFDLLGPGDWLCFDMIGGIWDLAQSEFTRMVYGEDVADKLLALRMEAEELIKADGMTGKDATSERARKVGFEGLEGRYDWPLIKKMHNDAVFDRAILNGSFNVFSTTPLTPLQDTDVKTHKWPMFEGIGRRPEGEKHQVHRHDTFAIGEKRDSKYLWKTDLGSGQGKDRGRELVRSIDYTDVGFIQSYMDFHDLGNDG